MKKPIFYLSTSLADDLFRDVKTNLDLYMSEGFDGFLDEGGWSIPLEMYMDMDLLNDLNPQSTAEAEISNSEKVWKALPGFTPSLACENRIWTRLSHIECLTFCRNRWLKNKSEEFSCAAVRKHFFANGRTGWRDDHAISRLWWNYYIAATAFPDDPPKALRLILKKSDIRQGFIERPWISMRRSLSSGIIRAMDKHDWLTTNEANMRNFMKAINTHGAGVVFESMTYREIDDFLESVAKLIQEH